MIKPLLSLLFLALPCVSQAQAQAQQPGAAPFNATTLTVLLANRPAHIEETRWLEMMQEPVHRTLHPLRITQAALDTLDARLLDRRFQYIMAR